MLVFPFLDQHTTFQESMINRLSNLINRNHSAAKISQVLYSSLTMLVIIMIVIMVCGVFYNEFDVRNMKEDSVPGC